VTSVAGARGWPAAFTVTNTGADVQETIPVNGRYTFIGSFSAGQNIGSIDSLGGASAPAEPSNPDVCSFMRVES